MCRYTSYFNCSSILLGINAIVKMMKLYIIRGEGKKTFSFMEHIFFVTVTSTFICSWNDTVKSLILPTFCNSVTVIRWCFNYFMQRNQHWKVLKKKPLF